MKFELISGLLLPIISIAQKPCRCLYSQTCWPNNHDFSELESELSQPLIHPVPPESACYPALNPSGNCTDVILHATDGNWRSGQPGSLQNINFETFIQKNGSISACYLNATLGFPCEQGSVPPVGVDAWTVEDVQAAVKFASKHNLRLVVKNTGHDYLGRSTARGGFLLWTHHLKNITYNVSFIPDGGFSNETFNAITLGAGVQWDEAYEAVQEQNRFIVGGISAGGSVGAAGGWIMGGGHSAFSPRHGLGVDNAIQFTIVNAKGDYVVANFHKNTDLFWALRGGGGGTYGVVISVTYRTHENFPLTVAVVAVNFSSAALARAITTEYVKLHPMLSDVGWGGYSSVSNQTLQMLYFAPNISWADTNTTLAPFFEFVRNTTSGLGVQAVTYPFNSFYSLYLAALKSIQGQVGSNVELGSRLIPREVVEEDPGKVADILLAIKGGVGNNFVAGGEVSKVDPESTGLNPSWRKALLHVYFTASWNDGDSSTVVKQAQQRIREQVKILDSISPDSGAYLNEASLFENNFQQTFFGSHYQRLKVIKNKYDPDGLFVVALGVGSDDWYETLNCRR